MLTCFLTRPWSMEHCTTCTAFMYYLTTQRVGSHYIGDKLQPLLELSYHLFLSACGSLPKESTLLLYVHQLALTIDNLDKWILCCPTAEQQDVKQWGNLFKKVSHSPKLRLNCCCTFLRTDHVDNLDKWIFRFSQRYETAVEAFLWRSLILPPTYRYTCWN